METIKTAETANSTIKVTLTRTVNTETAYLDGYDLPVGRKVYERVEVVITSKRSGASVRTSGEPNDMPFLYAYTGKSKTERDLMAKGAGARCGDANISREIYDLVISLIAVAAAETPKTDEQVALEQDATERKARGDANLERMAQEDAERREHPGWCDKCHSYCYGDCTA